MAYRQRAVAVVRAQLDALPTVNGVEADSYLTDSKDKILVVGQYPRRTFCSDVIAHYRQVAPISGWTFDRREQSSNGPIDYYAGIFQGYHLSLVIDCDTTQLGYRVHGTVPFPYDFALVGWITGAR
jgi:hypothetical protein